MLKYPQFYDSSKHPKANIPKDNSSAQQQEDMYQADIARDFPAVAQEMARVVLDMEGYMSKKSIAILDWSLKLPTDSRIVPLLPPPFKSS